MFRWLNNQGVASSDGYELQRVDRFHYQYKESGKVLNLVVERSLRCEELTLPPSWEPPHQDAPLTAQEIAKVRFNVGAALDFMKLQYRFVEDAT
jgi:hypothetical protein